MTTPQAPIGSRFNAASTAEDVIQGIDLSGKTAIVTGGYSGLGLETARVLRAAGARVIVPARDTERATAATQGIDVEILPMDLMDPASIDVFAAHFMASGESLHMLVNSAGIMAGPLLRDARGNESQFSTNHLGHFQLVKRLMPALRQADGARVVSVSSRGHRYSPVIFEDPNFEHRDYDRWKAYGQSKTANILFALALDERAQADGIRAFSLHPGSIVGTGLSKHVTHEELLAFGAIDEAGERVLDPSRQLKTIEQGAATSVWCATSPQLDGLGGVYCEDVEIARPNFGNPNQYGVATYAIDPEAAERLWTLSEQLI